MALDYTVEPIDTWPGRETPVGDRTRSPFKGSWSRTLEELEREVRFLDGRNVVLRVDVVDRMIGARGQLLADARPKSPRVLVEFDAYKRNGKPRLVFRCDRFRFWQDNVLAIALGMEKLRAVERYGVTDTSDQYAGFKKLPASTSPTLTAAAAADVVARFTDYQAVDILLDAIAARQAIRVAMARTHPDTGSDTDRDAFVAVQTARAVLSKHFGTPV